MQRIALEHLNRTRGFTLVELLVVLAVSAIILSFAVPSFTNIIANNRVSAAANEMVVALNLAKNEAVKTGQTAVLCKSADGNQCSNTAQWSNGWLVFIDEDGGGAVNNNERIIRVHEATDSRLNFDFFVNNAINPGPLKFKANGRIQPEPSGLFCFHNAHTPENSRAVTTSYAGQIRTEVRNAANNCAPPS